MIESDNHNPLGKQMPLTAPDAARQLMSSICESMQYSENGIPGLRAKETPDEKNIFGRPVTFHSSGDISLSVGFGSSGLRAGIMLGPEEISSNIDTIAGAARLHIPLVIFANVASPLQVHQVSHSGAVVFSAGSAQEAVNILLASYRIAELSLIPVVVCIDQTLSNTAENILFPGKELILHFAGNTDLLIPSPTPSQHIIFGKSRKRIPNWINPDNPVSLGAAKQPREAALEIAAKQEYFFHHLDEIIHSSFREFNELSGTTSVKKGEKGSSGTGESALSPVSLYPANQPGADYLVICSNSISLAVEKAIDEFRKKHKAKIAAARLVQATPFPENALKSILTGKKVVTVLEQSVNGTHSLSILNKISRLETDKNLKIFSGNYASSPSSEALYEVLNNMLPGGNNKSGFWTDTDFTHPGSGYPKHEVLLQAIEREYPSLQHKTLSSPGTLLKYKQPGNTKAGPETRIPLAVRKYKDHGPAYSKLSRFYDDTAGFILTDPEELVADPFQALPVMPPLTANFNSANSGKEREYLPEFYSARCTGCGDCFLHCPHTAINPLAISVENFIKSGLHIAVSLGIRITQFSPMVKNLVKEIHEEISKIKNTEAGISATSLISAAFERVAVQMRLDGEKLQAARHDINAVTNALKELPVSITDVFYHYPERNKKGHGELFSLAIDTNSCTGCGVCASACREEALQMLPETSGRHSEIIAAHQERYALWEQMPDTGADTITRLTEDSNYNPFSAILLSRHFNSAVNGRSMDQDGDASRSMIHLIAAFAEAALQPRWKEATKAIENLVSNLSQNIHRQLSSALPLRDFDWLSRALAEIKEDRKPFEALLEKLGPGDHQKLIDTRSLKRKVGLAESLKSLQWLLHEGPSGTGRTRMGFVLDGHLKWANVYPWNNFTAPVFILPPGTSPLTAKGLMLGLTRNLIDNIKIIRRAELEINDDYEPDLHDAKIASINWDNLTEQEKGLIPPVIMIVSKERIAGRDYSSLLNVLHSNLPIKIVVLDDAAPETDPAEADSSGLGTILPALASGKAHIIKSSLASPRHLFKGLSDVFHCSNPAMLWVFVPAVSKHLTPAESFPKLYAPSLDTRVFPLFSYNPHGSAAPDSVSLLSSKISLEGNPQMEALWVQNELSYKENGNDKILPYSLTWADWAYQLKSWREKFTPHPEDMGNALTVSEYLLLPKSERAGKTPVIFRIDQNNELKKYKVPDEVIRIAEASHKTWQLLRELSGEITEFPEKLQKKKEAELSEKYEKLMAEMKQEYENRIAGLERSHLEKIRIKLKEKLVQLSQQQEMKHQEK